MAQSNAATRKKVAPHVQPVVLDEELWFGSSSDAEVEAAASKSMAATAGTVLGAKSFPDVARRVAALASREDSRVDEIVAVLEQDPGMSGRLLRLVNSAAIGLRQPCTSVRQAVTTVGSKRLHELATTAAVLDLFDSRSAEAVVILEHSAVVGAFCRFFALRFGFPPDELFTLGMLHDLGMLMLLETSGDKYSVMLEQQGGHLEALFASERAEFGFDHGVLAAHVLKAWNIPDPIPKIVAWHHEPAKAYASSTLHGSLVQILRLADALETTMARGGSREDLGRLTQIVSADYLDASEAQLDAMWGELAALRASTLSQKRGESEFAALNEKESATRVRSARPKPMAPPEHQDMWCIECKNPSYGAVCSACGGYVCSEHLVDEGDWCGLCAAEYPAFAAKIRFSLTPLRGATIALVITGFFGAIGWATGETAGLLRGIAIGVVLSTACIGLLHVVRHAVTHARFRRTRPHRAARD